MSIKSILKSIVKRIYPKYFHFSLAYSQDGEDMVLHSFYEEQYGHKGYYVDIGAHHPYRFSNTQFFYDKGWCGINIDPTPNSIKAFEKHRKRDINLNLGIAQQKSSLTFYQFDEPGLNSFDKEISYDRNENTPYNLIKETTIDVVPLSEVLDKHLPKNQAIDFFDIDVEGFDLEVLKSNNWEKYLPNYILVECSFDTENLKEDEIHCFLVEKSYQLVARTQRTSFYKLNKSISI